MRSFHESFHGSFLVKPPDGAVLRLYWGVTTCQMFSFGDVITHSQSPSQNHVVVSVHSLCLRTYGQNVFLCHYLTLFFIHILLPVTLRCGTHTVSLCGLWVWWVGWSLSGPWWKMGRLCVSTLAGVPTARSPSTWLVLLCPWGLSWPVPKHGLTVMLRWASWKAVSFSTWLLLMTLNPKQTCALR